MLKMNIKEWLQFLKVKEYYKNLLIYLPIFFVGNLFNISSFLRVSCGFIALCIISSSYYIFNDINDLKGDRYHVEKRLRPLASGKISVGKSIIISVFLALLSLIISYNLNIYFFMCVSLLFILSMSYSFLFKKIFILDILFISLNFVIRPLSGVFLIYKDVIVKISPWLIFVSFYLAFYLITSKRRSNILFLGNKLEYNSLLKKYNYNVTRNLYLISTILLIIVYSLFTFNSDYPLLFITIPLVVYAIIYHHHLVENGSRIGRDLVFAFKEKVLMSSIILWSIISFVIIYIIH